MSDWMSRLAVYGFVAVMLSIAAVDIVIGIIREARDE